MLLALAENYIFAAFHLFHNLPLVHLSFHLSSALQAKIVIGVVFLNFQTQRLDNCSEIYKRCPTSHQNGSYHIGLFGVQFIRPIHLRSHVATELIDLFLNSGITL
jgi:hypothetical protein